MRRFIWKSEKAAHRPTSLISQKKSSWLGIFNSRNAEFSERQRLAVFVGLILFLSVIGLGSLNEYIRRHRTVYVRNEFAPLAKVIIDGKIQIPDRASSNIELPEGVHHVNVTGTINEEFDVNLHANYFQRWTYSPAWVVNVGGATPMSVERVLYAAVPQPSESAVSVGEHLLFAPHVDYLFTPAPRTLKVEGGSKQVTKENLIVLSEPAAELFDFALEHSEREDAIRFAQSRLLLNPADDALLYAYASTAEPGPELEDLKAFLNRQLSRRPVLVSWHRCFQELHKGVAGKKSLIPTYDALLAKEPDNGALLYLRGRLDPSPAGARRYHHRAVAADPTLGWPWMALAFDAASRAEWGACKEFAAGARDRGLTDEVQALWTPALMGLDEEFRLVQECRQRIEAAGNTPSLTTTLDLAVALVAIHNVDGAMREVDRWEASLTPEDRQPAVTSVIRGIVEFAAEDYAAVGKRIDAGELKGQSKLFYLLILGRPDAAAADEELAETLDDPWKALSLSIALDLQDQAQPATQWREKACDTLSQRDYGEALAARLLRGGQAPTIEELNDVVLLPGEKALLACGLAARFPDAQTQYLDVADRLAVELGGFSAFTRYASARMRGLPVRK